VLSIERWDVTPWCATRPGATIGATDNLREDHDNFQGTRESPGRGARVRPAVQL
jgi:hypothetical protein